MKEFKTITINGVTYTVADPDAASTDDSKVGADAWSSKNIVDKLCPFFTESGAIVTCEPVEGYHLAVEWQRKNLIDFFNISATEYCPVNNSDGTIGKKTGYMLRGLEVGSTYTISFSFKDDANICGYLYLFYQKTGQPHSVEYITTDVASIRSLSFVVEKDTEYFIARGGTLALSQSEIDKFATFQLEKGSKATAYEPYAETATITRCGKNLAKPKSVKNETITGITVEIQDDGTFILNGTAQVDYANGYLTNYLLNSHGNRNKYPPGTYFLKVRELGGSFTNGYAQAAINAPSGTQYLAFTNSTLKVVLTEASEVSVFIQFRTNTGVAKADNYHISVQMELGSTATEYEPYNAETFNPGETIPALPGVNTIFADVGEITVAGRADLNAINRKTAERLAALEAALVNT